MLKVCIDLKKLLYKFRGEKSLMDCWTEESAKPKRFPGPGTGGGWVSAAALFTPSSLLV